MKDTFLQPKAFKFRQSDSQTVRQSDSQTEHEVTLEERLFSQPGRAEPAEFNWKVSSWAGGAPST